MNKNKYYVGYRTAEDMIYERLTFFEGEADAAFNSEEWVLIYADSKEAAIEKYPEEREKWENQNK